MFGKFQFSRLQVGWKIPLLIICSLALFMLNGNAVVQGGPVVDAQDAEPVDSFKDSEAKGSQLWVVTEDGN